MHRGICVIPDEAIAEWFATMSRRSSRNMLNFVEWMGRGWYNTNWHHRLICETLDRWARREEGYRRVMLFMPAQTGKSQLVSRFLPAYTLGHHPDDHFIAASYSAALASEFNRDLQLIFESPEYRAAFPAIQLPTPRDRGYTRTTEQIDLVGKRGGYRSTGVGGSITGHGAHYFVIDDPIKNAEEAYSQAYRDSLWQWFVTTAFTRQTSSDTAILITVTRWHEDDICGRLLKLAEQGGEQWRVIRFPAIADDNLSEGDPRKPGDALWPERYPLEMLTAARKQVGEQSFQAMYQQTPTSAEGSEIKRHWWQWYDLTEEMLAKPKDHFEHICSTWDCAFKDEATSDYVVGQVWGVKGAKRYLLDQVRDRMDFPATIAAMLAMRDKWKPNSMLVEDKANGSAVISTLQKNVSGIIAIEPKGGKIVRARAVAPQIESGQVFLPNGKHFSELLVDESAAFPLGTNDDQVDAMSQALTYLMHFGTTAAAENFNQRTSFANETVSAYTTKAPHELMKIFPRTKR